MTSPELGLINPLFYDPFINKSTGNLELVLNELSKLFNVDKTEIYPLQYWDLETKTFIQAPRVYMLNNKGKFLKIRYNQDESEAFALLKRANFAYSIGIPMSKPLGNTGKYSLFEYIKGKPINSEDLSRYLDSMAAIQTTMNSLSFESNVNKHVEELTKNMIKRCFSYLININVESNILDRLESKLSKINNLIATFDHQDYGIHNVIVDEGNNVNVMDEEAFGIIPLGYGIIRPIYGGANYRAIKSKNPNEYLKFFDSHIKDYMKDNLNLMRAMFILRNSVRRFTFRNEKGARKLLMEANELK